jgi:tetratricopeptide (TPR) repeat protein
MKKAAIILGAAIALLPLIGYLNGLRYQFDPALAHSVCHSIVCPDDLLLESAERMIRGDRRNIPLGLATLQETLRRNPASPQRWSEFGETLVKAGKRSEAEYAFRRAVDLGSQSPPVLWRAGLFYLRNKQERHGMELMARLLDLAPEYRTVVFNLYLFYQSDVCDALEFGITRQSRLGQDYFRYLLKRASEEDINKAWECVQQHSLDDYELSAQFAEFLIGKNDYRRAMDLWARAARDRDHAYLKPNLVFNGGFELESRQAGPDWRFSNVPGTRVQRDSTVALSGSASLSVEFAEENVDFNNIAQTLILQPGRYQFKGSVRTADLTTDHGIGFRLADSSRRIDLKTQMLTGTNDWTPVTLDFTVPQPVRTLQVSVIRQKSWKFDSKISGRAWIDDVSVTPLQ